MTEVRKVPKAAKIKSHLQNREVSGPFLLHVWASEVIPVMRQQ